MAETNGNGRRKTFAHRGRPRSFVLARREAFEEHLRQQRLTPEAIALSGGPNEKTIRKALHGVPVFRSSLVELLRAARIEDIEEWIALPHDADASSLKAIGGMRGSLMEWQAGKPITPVITASNGLQYRVFRLTHRFDEERVARGKRYEFFHLSDDASATLRDLLLRHPKTCDRVGNHPQLPRCFGTFPEPDSQAWWAVDEWIAGETLQARLKAGRLIDADLARIAVDILLGLQALHRAGIIRRELSPVSILISEKGRTVLTDFELAKLLDGSPSVSRDWPDDPYRAPEVGGGEVNHSADIYSFGRILIHAALGELPGRGTEPKCLPRSALPPAVRELALRSVDPRRSKRPQSVSEMLPVIQAWS